MKQVKLLYPFKNSSYQTFLQDMADSMIEAGVKYIKPKDIPWSIRHFVAKMRICRNFKCLTRKTSVIVLAGGYPDSFAFPFCYTNEIIPILWDTWPKYWNLIVSSFKRNNIKLAFFTQKQVAEYVNSQLPEVQCYHLPEGIASKKYIKESADLINRKIDLLELGRVFAEFHNSLELTGYNHLYQKGNDLLFPTFDELIDALRDSKLTVCFPRNMTHPFQAGFVETLTQRYWECMLTKTLIVGHAPQELIDLIGYNPVVEIDLSKDVNKQIITLLNRIETYQSLVDKNFDVALQRSDWKFRAPFVIERIKEHGLCL